MTKMEVLGMLDDMEEETLRSNGLIAGFVTETFVINMIRRKKEEVGAKEDGRGNSSPAACRKEDGAGGGDGQHTPGRCRDIRQGSEGKADVCAGKRPEGYEDILLYVPETRQVIRIAEGSGDNLLEEDIREGYVDYIYYEQHEAGVGMPVVNGGQILLKDQLRDRYWCMAGCIPEVLDMAYGDSGPEYMIL